MTYQAWVFNHSTGAKTAYLENAIIGNREKKINQTPTISLSLPADDDKAIYLTSAYDLKIYNTVKARWEDLWILDDVTESWNASGSIMQANYSGAMAQLVEENIPELYDTGVTPHTPTTIITELLAYQKKTPAITVGTIQPTTTFAFAIENTNILSAILKCVDYLGGYIEVDEDRHLNWYNEPSGNPVREIRYQKNMKGVTRKRDFTNVWNRVYAYGYGETEAQVTLIDAGETYEYIENSTSQTANGIKIKRITDKRIIHPATLLKWAQLFLATYKDPAYTYTVDVVNLAEHSDFDFDYENLEVGQIVRVINSDLNSLNVNVKLVSVTVNLSKPEEITVELANATKDLSDSFSDVKSYTDLAQNVAVQIGAGQVTVQGTFTVDGWRTAGTTTIDGGNITTNTLAADSIKTSTLNAKTITLGTTGGDSIIKSGNYAAGSAGWQIKANGDAEFNNVIIRGKLYTCTLESGATITLTGDIESSNFVAGTSGWKLNGSGAAEIRTLYCYNINATYEIYANLFRFRSNTGNPKLTIDADGTHLYFTDGSNVSHTLV